MRKYALTFALLLAPFALAGMAHSQQAPEQSQPSSTQSAANAATAAETEDPSSTHTAPVFWISSVEVLRSAHPPQLDVIRVRGMVPTNGWNQAELVPLTKGSPVDGVLDLALVAEAPTESTTPATFTPLEAIFVLEPGHPFRGLRVHGAANRVTLQSLPGYQEAPAPPASCEDCVGKYFAPKGEPPSSGHKPSEQLREDDLPKNLRVIRDSDGIKSLDQDPNRLTLLLNASGQVVSAFWD